MAKIITDSLIRGICGKICSHDETIIATRRKNGHIYTSRICNPSEAAPTAKQIAAQMNFTSRSKAVAQWIADNKPSDSQPKGTEAYQKALAAYDAQSKCSTLFSYCSKVLVANGTITYTKVKDEDIAEGATNETDTDDDGTVVV